LIATLRYRSDLSVVKEVTHDTAAEPTAAIFETHLAQDCIAQGTTFQSSSSLPTLIGPQAGSGGGGSYHATFRRIFDLTSQDRRRMADLYLSYYDGTSESLFFSDLENKTEVLLVYCDGVLVGFTTLALYERRWNNGPILVVFSGDTIVDRLHWQQQALAFAWISRMGSLRKEHPGRPMFWFLIVKGHRTYRYLPAFCNSFYPHWLVDRPDLKALADMLARERFGDAYNPESGLVEFAQSKGHLKPQVAFPEEKDKRKDAVRFFLEKNPEYLRGHELVCVSEIASANLKPLARRIFEKGALCGKPGVD
jgi:hypothetical protein